MPDTITYEGEKLQTAGDYTNGRIPKVALTDATGTAITLDKSGGLKTVTEFQNAVHDGESFSYSVNQIGLANNGVVSMLGRTDIKQVHFDGFTVKTSTGPFRIQLYEAPTVTEAGTLISTRRRNRANTNVSLMTVYSAPTYSNAGLILDDDLIVETSLGAHENSGVGSVDDGWVLKANTDYLIVMTNISGVALNWSAKFTWHEASYNV